MDFKLDDLFLNNEARIHRAIAPANELPIHQTRLEQIAERHISEKTHSHSTLNESQKAVILEMAKWICGSGKPQNGIMLVGSVGTGKTTLMQAFILYYNWLYKKVIREFHAKTLPIEIKAKGIDWFYRRPIYIDDLGKESAITAEYGQKFDTWGDIFAVRYESKALTFATANYSIDGQFKEIYGDVIANRMKEHFNIFEITGASLRK